MKQPNILIVMTDQQQDNLRKSRGYPLDTMPFLDSFAREGADCTRAYTPNPTCMPARVSMFTGRYPSCHRVRTNHNATDAYYTEDLLDVLKCAGYRTALCGKNHSHRNPADFDFHETKIRKKRRSSLRISSALHAIWKPTSPPRAVWRCSIRTATFPAS